MATVKIRRHADKSYPVKAAVTGGQVVEGTVDSGVDKVQAAGAGSLVVLGVAYNDASPDDTSTGSAVNVNPLPTAVTVGNGEFYVTYAAAATVGQALIAAANGQVTPAGATPDARTVIGYCTATTASGAVGPAYIGR